jgi:hypothetical protein
MTREKAVLLVPVLLTIFLVLWWVLEEKRSSYGSWQVYLALAIMPLVLIWHIGLIVSRKPRLNMVVFAAAHLRDAVVSRLALNRVKTPSRNAYCSFPSCFYGLSP